MQTKEIYFILFVIIFTLNSCNDNPIENENINFSYEKPYFITPEDSTIFYSFEEIRIEWKLPDGLINSEIQEIKIPEFYNPKYKVKFDTTNFSISYGTQTSYVFSFGEPELFDTVEFRAYRARSLGAEGKSDWSDIISICIKPMNKLTIKRENIQLDFNFVASESGRYYSGIDSNRTFSYDSLLNKNNYDKDNIILVRPISGRLYCYGDDSDINRKIDRLIVGIGNIFSNTQVEPPFDIFADTYLINPENSVGELTLYPYGGSKRNLNQFLETNNLYHLSYFLADSIYVGERFSFTAEFDSDFYIKEE